MVDITEVNVKRASVDDLNIIRTNRASGGGTEDNELMQDIKDALIGSGSKDNLASVITDEIRNLIQEVRRIGINTATTAKHATGEQTAPETTLGGVGEIAIILDDLRTALLGFGEGVREHGQAEKNAYFSSLARINEYEKMFSKTNTNIDKFFGLNTQSYNTFFGNFKAQQAAMVKDINKGITDFGLKLVNLGQAFSNAKQSIIESAGGYMKDVFGTAVMSPQEYFLDGWTRLTRGVLLSSDSLMNTFGLVKSSLESGIISPLAMTGKTISEYAGDLYKMREDMSRMPGGAGLRGVLTTTQQEKISQDMLEQLHAMGIHANIDSNITESYTLQQISLFKIISANTGMTVARIEELTKQFTKQSETLVALQAVSPTQGRSLVDAATAISSTIGPELSKPLTDLIYKFAAGHNMPQEIIEHDKSMGPFFSLMGNAAAAMANLTQVAESRQVGESEADFKMRLDKAITLFSNAYAHDQNTYQFQHGLGDTAKDLQKIAEVEVAANQYAYRGAPSTAQLANINPTPTDQTIGKMQDLWTNVINPLFGGLSGHLNTLTIAMVANTTAVWANTGTKGGIVGTAAKFLGGATIAGAAGVGIAEATGNNNTGGLIGGGAGSIAGGIGGSMLGRLIGGGIGTFAGPIGTAIGVAAGGFIGSYLGNKIEGMFENSAPAVPPVANPVGPTAQAAVVSADNSQQIVNTQDDSVGLLGRIVGLLQDNNTVTGQLLTETARQTGILSGGTGTPSPSGVPTSGGISGRTNMGTPGSGEY